MENSVDQIWDSLSVPNLKTGIVGRRAPNLAEEEKIFIALDSKGNRHLLVKIPQGTEPLITRQTHGLQIVTDAFKIGDEKEDLFIDLICGEPTQYKTFSAVAQDLISSLQDTTESTRNTVKAALGRWKAFWALETPGLSREEALGLFGELWFLYRWLGKFNMEVLNRWQATVRGRHDYQWAEASVEVKTAALSDTSWPTHRINGLDQLAGPVEGQLYLFSLQVADDSLSSNNLAVLVQEIIREIGSNNECLDLFNEKLASYGYNPAEADSYIKQLRIVAERLFIVNDDFPRLTADSFQPSLPPGIGEVQYTLETAVCDKWMIATGPNDPAASFLNE